MIKNQLFIKCKTYFKNKFKPRHINRELRGTLFSPYRSDPAGQSISLKRLRPAYHLILEDGCRQKKIEN